jgi:4-hydroxy-3-methylbut-2-enyl diphosphate reductase IspH
MLAAGLLLAIDAEIQETNDWVSTVGSAVTSNSQALSAVSQQMTQINSVLVQKVDTFTADVRKAINDRFQNLPAELVSSPVIQKLKADIEADILKQVSATLANGNQKVPVVPGPAKP